MQHDFSKREQAHQSTYFQREFAAMTGHRGRPFQLKREFQFHGLLSLFRDEAIRLFDKDCLNIQWHPYIGHGRSSQACCLNFLMPMARRPEVLKNWAQAVLGDEVAEVLPIEHPIASPHLYVAFEYTGPNGTDYLDEADGKTPKRGAHATASDAAFAYRDAGGRSTLVLVEWKYTEEYRNHKLSEDREGKRHARYVNKMFWPDGPILSDLALQFEHFLHEPFYQLVRQQMLAQRIEADPASGFDEAIVLHLSPRDNLALRHVTSPGIAAALEAAEGIKPLDAFAAYKTCLARPDRFLSIAIEDAFSTLAQDPEAAAWYPDLKKRYPSLCPA